MKTLVQALCGFLLSLLVIAHPAAAQVDALLPYKDAVPAAAKLPIDGVYKISSTGTRIRIEGGRGYALDQWTQLFFLIRENMVTMQNIKRLKAGRYTGYDLPLLSDASLDMQADGSLKVGVMTITGPASFILTPLAVDDPNGFNTERVAAGHKGPRLKIPPVATARDGQALDTAYLKDSTKTASPRAASNVNGANGANRPAMPIRTGLMTKACARVAGKDPDTGLDICDYPLPELN